MPKQVGTDCNNRCILGMRLPLRISLVAVIALVNAGALTANSYSRMESEKFMELPGLTTRVDTDQPERALLAAAIFHETNRVRREMGLPAFKPNRRLDDAADLQAGMAAATGRYDHSNPIHGRESVAGRAREAGLGDGAVAENVATTPLVEVAEDQLIVIQRENDRRTLRDAATGKELPTRTYAGYAGEVVKQWMNSPGHRANILSREYRALGCSVRFSRLPNGVDVFVAVQVFHAPLNGKKGG